MFSDSQLRPIVEGRVSVPGTWYFNSTPGGCFRHIAEEVENVKLKSKPAVVALLVGTNDLAQHVIMERARKSFYSLLLTAKKKFNGAKVQ